MKNLLLSIAREVTPPIFVKGARKIVGAVRGRAPMPEWEWLPHGFAQARADAKVKGWNEQSVLDSYLAKFEAQRAQLATPTPFGLADAQKPSDVGNWVSHNVAASFGCALSRVAGNNKQISILDWGGALGHYLWLARALRPDLEFDYTVKEMPLFMELGRRVNPDARFCDDERVFEEQFDLVISSCALNYDENWRRTFENLAKCARLALFVTRSPTTLAGESYVYVQRPYAYGYQTEYASWCLNRAEVLAAGARCGLRLDREFLCGETPPIQRVPSPCEYRGFLWLR